MEKQNTNGKIPPQAIDIEEAVLGAALIDSSGVSQMVEVLRKVNVFYKPQHQEIYSAILELYERSEGVDLLTVSEKLQQRKKLLAVGGDHKLVELTQAVSSSAHMEYHCRILMQMFVRRKTIRLGLGLQKNGYNDDQDIFDLLESTQKKMDETTEWLMVKKPGDFEHIVDKLFDRADKKQSGIPSGIPALQKRLNGYQQPNLIILAARPGMGKTALMLNEALSMAKKGIPVGIFSLEMGDTELAARMMSNELEIDNERLALNKLNADEIELMNEKRQEFSKLPIYIYDQPGISPLELKIQASKWKRDKGVKMIFMDYLQLMKYKTRSGNREQEVSEISRSLKGVAKELEMPVMALSQLNRSVENRGGMKRPLLADLRESGAIEQDADIVMFLYRPEYYGIDTWDDEHHSQTYGEAEVNFAKFRNGDTGAVKVGVRLKHMKFYDLDEAFNNSDENIFIPPPPNSDFEAAFGQPDDTDEIAF